MSYLFLVSIGPVQGFIASARRTRDLSFGSQLLSEIAKAAARKIVEIEGPYSLIFPFPNSNQKETLDADKPFNVANKIVALIQHSPKDLGQFIQEAIFDQLHDIRDKAYRQIKLALPVEKATAAYAQIEDLIDFQWVALPFEEHTYVETRRMLEALMAARKNTRNFARVTWYSQQPKSSIDGQLESVIPEDAYPPRGASDVKKFEKIRALYKTYHASPAERLSGVDLLKRRGEMLYGSSFPSTSHIATLPFLQRLELVKDRAQAKEKWNEYIKKVKHIADPKGSTVADEEDDIAMQRVDVEKIARRFYSAHPILQDLEGSMLFEERLVDLVDVIVDNDKLKEAKNALRKFYEFTDGQFASLGLSNARPNPYYAILLADGDRMGEVIDAQAEQKIHDGEHGYEQHRRISQTLSRFAGGVDATVRKHQGALVYAGGDDVLAFVPLHMVLQCAKELAKNFKATLSTFSNKTGKTPTLSVGVAIIHHLKSLQDALDLARVAEKKAKQVKTTQGEEKNALAIIVSKRSGENYNIEGTWGDIDEYLEQLITFCRADDIPNGTAYELRNLARRLTVPKGHSDFNILQAAIKADAVRILHRKLYVPLGKLTEEKAKVVEKFLKARLGVEQDEPPKIQAVDDIEKFINELIIAQVLADAQHLANLPEKGVKQ